LRTPVSSSFQQIKRKVLAYVLVSVRKKLESLESLMIL
jgi:hypothetical protein